MTPFSRRASSGIAPNRLTRALESRRANGEEVLDLTVTNPTLCGLAWPQGSIERALAAVDATAYRPEPFGSLVARVAICNELAGRGLSVTPGRVVLTSSTSEAYAFLLKLLCDPGDRIAVPSPGYPLIETLASLDGVAIAPFRFEYDGRWRIDEESLSTAASPPTRAITLVHPNNPTGAFVAREDFELVRSFGLPIVSDEVFGDYVWHDDATRALTLIADARDSLVLRLDGLSKSALLPQLKLAWTVVDGPEALVRKALARLEHIADAYLSPSVPVQLALPELLAAAPAMRAKVEARCRASLEILTRACAGSALTLLGPEGGWSAVMRLPDVHDDEAWALLFLEKAGVFVHPGYLYDFETGSYVVVSLLGDAVTLGAAMERMLIVVARECRG